MQHIFSIMTFAVFISTTAFAGNPVSCTIHKFCKGPEECKDADAPMHLEMSETSLDLGFYKQNMTLDVVAGTLGVGITYAGKDIDNTYTVLTVQQDGSGFMSGHRLGLKGILFSAYFNCEGIK